MYRRLVKRWIARPKYCYGVHGTSSSCTTIWLRKVLNRGQNTAPRSKIAQNRLFKCCTITLSLPFCLKCVASFKVDNDSLCPWSLTDFTSLLIRQTGRWVLRLRYVFTFFSPVLSGKTTETCNRCGSKISCEFLKKKKRKIICATC